MLKIYIFSRIKKTDNYYIENYFKVTVTLIFSLMDKVV